MGERYFVFWEVPGTYGQLGGESDFDTAARALEFINRNPSYEYRVIRGREVPLEAAEVVKSLRFKE